MLTHTLAMIVVPHNNVSRALVVVEPVVGSGHCLLLLATVYYWPLSIGHPSAHQVHNLVVLNPGVDRWQLPVLSTQHTHTM